MDYIDWIISSFVFLLMVSLVLITISSIIPTDNNEDYFSRSIFNSTLETIPTYNVSINSSDSEIYPYSFIVDNNYGISQNIFTLDGNKYYGIIKDKDQFFDYNFTGQSDPYGIRVLKESFNDFDYNDNFTISPEATINSGILVLDETSTITTDQNYFDYFGFFSTTNIVNVYVSYTDINNNYFCKFSDSTITIGKTENSTQTILKTTPYSKEADWHRVYFGYTKNNLINCNAGDTETNYQDGNIIPKTQIVISTIYNNTLLDDFYIYLNNDLDSNSSGTITGNYIDANITDNVITIKTTDNNILSTLDFNLSEELEITTGKGISFVKDSEEENKLIFFPQAKEFWGYKDSDENIEITLDENTGLDLDISEIEELALWLDASSLELTDGQLVASWTDLSGNNRHATQSTDGNKPVFKTNVLNGHPAIRFDGNGTLLSTSNLELTGDKYSIVSVLKNTKTTGISGFFSFSAYFQGVYFGSAGNIWRGSGWGGNRININNFTNNIFLINSVIKTGGTTLQDPNFNLKIYNNTIDSTGTIGTDEHTFDTSNNVFLRIGCWGATAYSFGGDLSEFIVFNKVLTDNERLFIENYLSQKYNINVENGLSFTDNFIELINLNENKKIIKLEFFDKETNQPIDCNYEYKNKKITINNCESDAVIKTRFRLNGVPSFPEYPKVSITKTKEQMITKDKFDSLVNQSYYLRLFNKVSNLENITNRPTTKIYRNSTALLWENGFLEEISAEIKPFN